MLAAVMPRVTCRQQKSTSYNACVRVPTASLNINNVDQATISNVSFMLLAIDVAVGGYSSYRNYFDSLRALRVLHYIYIFYLVTLT
jgi:hypothetical protein